MSSAPRFSARFLRALLIGLPGIAVLPLVIPAPEGVPVAALLINPLFLLILAALAGGWAAPRLGLSSALILGSRIRLRALVPWLVAGTAAGIVVAFLDHALADIWQIGLPTVRQNRDAAILLLGLLYGGINEELMLRWGLMSLFAAGLVKLLPRESSLWIAAVVAAILFALGHLPAVMMEVDTITPALFLRTLLWNGLLGLVFGAAFLRHSLEAAILAHMGVHAGFFLAAF